MEHLQNSGAQGRINCPYTAPVHISLFVVSIGYVSLSHCQQARYVHQFVHQFGAGHGPPPVPTYIYTGCYTHQLLTLITTISCLLVQSNGSLTYPFAGGVTAGVHNEGGDIFITLR